MITCHRCGRELEYAYEHNGEYYGSECIEHVTGRKFPTRTKKNGSVSKTIWKVQPSGLKHFKNKYGKWKPMLMSEYLRWKRDGETIYVSKHRYLES